MAAYNAANFGLEGFSQSLAKELAEEQITVNCMSRANRNCSIGHVRKEGLYGKASIPMAL